MVNIADPNDVVALRKDLSPLFPPPEGRWPIEDRLVDIEDSSTTASMVPQH